MKTNLKALSCIKICFLSVVLALFFSDSSFSQEIANKFGHVSTSDQFSLNSVTSLAQSKNGLMWFGTRKGLISYDGIETKFYKNKTQGKFSAGYSDITSILIDKAGKIWMASRSGLSVYDPVFDSFEIIPLIVKHPTQTVDALCLTETADGEIWVGTNDGIFIYNHESKKLSHLLKTPKNKLATNAIKYIYQTKDATIWLATDKGLIKTVSAKNGAFEFQIFAHNSADKAIISNNNINTLLEDAKGNLWVGTQNGLDYFDVAKKSFSHFKIGLINDAIRSLTFDDKSRLWVGTYEGIIVIDAFKVVASLKHDPNSPLGLVDNRIRALFKDKFGSIWIGSYYGGINYWNERQFNFNVIDEGNGQKLGFKVVSSAVEDTNRKIYFGTEGEGISVLDEKTASYSYIKYFSGRKKLGAVKTLFMDGPANLWIGTFSEGLIDHNLKTKTEKIFTHNPKDKFSLSSNKILSIAKNDENSLWVGTLNEGLNLLNLNTGKSTVVKTPPQKTPIIIGTIRCLLSNKVGELYIGTPQDVLRLQTNGSDKVTDFTITRIPLTTASKTTTNQDISVQDIYKDKQGRIWVATQNLGLLQLIDGKLQQTGIQKDVAIYSILQGKDDLLWLSSSAGIIRYSTANRTIKTYNANDGVPGNEFLRGAKLYSSSGKIYFGGASGVTTFDPNKLGLVNSIAPNVIVTGFKLFDEPIEVGDSTKILTKSIENTKKIGLDYDQNILTINFSMPNFIKTGSNTYYYRLIGLDTDWIKTSKTSVSYTIQQGGNYRFEVRGVNEDGYATKETTFLEINVASAPWKTWWAYTIYTLIILGAFGLISYFFRSKLILQHKLDLEKREFNTHQELNKHKLQFFTNVSHEFRTPLTLISGPLQTLLDDYKGPHKLFKQLLVIKKNTDQLNKLINELLDFRKFEDSQMKLNVAEGNIVEFLEEIFLSFSLQAKINDYQYTFETGNEEILAFFDANKLEKVFYNLLSNAFKHTPKKGEISLQIEKNATDIKVIVKDSGDGMEASELNKIFDHFYEIQGQKNYGEFKYSSGIGLAIVKSVVDLHKGNITVESGEGVGSIFTVTLQLGRDHLNEDEISKSAKNVDPSQYSVEKLQIEDSIAELPDIKNDDKKSVLIIEDNVGIANFIKDVLSEDYNITIAENGVVGYKCAITQHPNLIISDMMMPEMDGLELCAKIKADIRTSHIPFILLSARTSLVHKYDGLESGADDYLFKPFEVKELLLKCKNIIATHDRLKEKFLNSNVFVPSELPLNSLDEIMMQKAFQIVKDNISNEFFGIEQFSEELGMSRSLLFTKIKAWTNQTPNDFMLSIRIKQAAAMIEQDRYSIAEVGYKVGFKDPSYFSKIFKKHLNVTPKVYSEKFKEGS